MNKFQILIEALRTDLIVFIDDDFTAPSNAGEAIAFISYQNQINYELLLDRIDEIDSDLRNLIVDYRSRIQEVKLSEQDHLYIESGLILELVKDEKFDEGTRNLVKKIYEKIEQNFATPGSELAKALMNHGLVGFTDALACYRPFFTSIKQLSSRKITRVYNDLEGENFNLFCTEIINILKLLDNKHFLVIVDKMLANNQDGNTLIDDLRKRPENIHTFFSILFTSKKSDPPVVPTSHFHFEVQKQENDNVSLQQVSEGLALCAFAVLFNKLSELNKLALEEAKHLVLESGKENILYLASMAQTEGEHVYNAINNWFGLLVQKKIDDKLFNQTDEALDYNFIVGLTSLINLDFLESRVEQISQEFKKVAQELSSFELFNYKVNATYSPPAPGDIYLIGDQLYILTGQDCDLIVRKNKDTVCRKDGLAEMVKVGFIPHLLDGKISDGQSSVTLNFFLLEEIYGSLKIKLNERIFFDFRLLDLCSLNKEGESRFSDVTEIPDDAGRALPQMWRAYYPSLHKDLLDKVKIFSALKEAGINTVSLSLDKSFSLEPKVEDGVTHFKVRRIARLKGNFRDYFLHRYWEYKTRLGLNNILVSNREQVEINNFEFGFFGNLKNTGTKPRAWVQLSHNRDINEKNKNSLPVIFNKEEISLLLDEPFKELFEPVAGDEIIINKGEYTELGSKILAKRIMDGDAISVSLIFPYFNEITNHHLKAKPEMTLFDLFPREFLERLNIPEGITCKVRGEERVLFEGKRPQKFTITDLEDGVVIDSINLGFKLDITKGKITEIKLNDEENTGQIPAGE
jgi:hypothetical protein